MIINEPFQFLLGALIPPSVLFVFWIWNRTIEQNAEKKAKAKSKSEAGFAAIRNAETVEEKIFRSNPANDGKPFFSEVEWIQHEYNRSIGRTTQHTSRDARIEAKLDRIIELLEREGKI